MLLLTIVLLLTAVLDQSLGEEEAEELKAKREEDEEEDENEEGEEDDKIIGSGVPLKAQMIIVHKHNEIRRMVKPPASNMLKMQWNETIGENALRWAERCILSNSPKESRKLGDMECGETIYQANHVTQWTDVIDFWKGGKKDFMYGVGAKDPRRNIFGYTQLIWYNSYIVGCAAAYCPDITFPFVYICQYCPGGNLMSQIPTPYKKGPSCADCPKNCEDKLCTNPCKYKDTILNCNELKSIFSCKKRLLVNGCQATCRCKTEIV
ncbi:serotriflin-like [Eublepharis macularius]|uniref:Serotriflin-like n=1 Tax=Eublepharis macularius TaxID=481883 RepID=A0AA97IVZ0_EUBMA|nr:serotriflin-like [Eublepharis macularius]